MIAYLSVALGGAVGATLRYVIGQILPPMKSGFPYATLVINVLGCLLIGALYVLIVERAAQDNYLRELLIVGALGGFTTFSTFSLETLHLWQSGQASMALLYIVLSVVFCIVATLTAVSLVRLI